MEIEERFEHPRKGQQRSKQMNSSKMAVFLAKWPSLRPAVATAKLHSEHDKWASDDPKDWHAILTEMRHNVQERAGSHLEQQVRQSPDDRHATMSRNVNPPPNQNIHKPSRSHLKLELRRLEIRLLMQTADFTPPDLCPQPQEQFQPVALNSSYPVAVCGDSWEAALKRATDLFDYVGRSDLQKPSIHATSALFDLAQSLEDLCMYTYAHTVASWALQIRLNLYHTVRDAHRRDLATVLSLEARLLAGLGRLDNAANAAQEGVQHCREDPMLHGVRLANALHAQALVFNAAGMKLEAKAAASEAVEILESAEEDKPELKHYLALAQASLAHLLVNGGNYQEALAAAHGAITTARALVGVADSRPALASALLIKANALSALGDKSAYVASVHATRHLRALVSERPALTISLAKALILSARHLEDAGFTWEARKSAEEAVGLLRMLHASAPQVFVRHLAEALAHLVQLRTAADGAEADVFDIAQEAAVLFRAAALHDAEPLGAVLVVVATQLRAAGQPAQAAPSAVEAADIYRRLWTQRPDEHAHALVAALRLASACRAGTEEALEHAKEAVQVHKQRTDGERLAREQLLTRLLMDVVVRLKELGREVEAIPWKTEAAKLNMALVELSELPPTPNARRLEDLRDGDDGDSDIQSAT
ncbi:hypothetical protein BC834DRAFT_33650 [Gloeopeniophorella convolvens]|nr:hypothetical protein BC834DRAFT_33650 [Gloeopeniophorella convolvens]